MVIKKRGKYCPKCGAKLKQKDQYCTACGYSFKKRKKELNIRNLIILIIIIIVAWLLIRLISGNPLIPQPLLDIFTNNTSG